MIAPIYDVETIALLGGHPALDFANTIEDRAGSRPEDTLRTPVDLRRWGLRLGLLATAPAEPLAGTPAHDTIPEAADGELRAALGLRETLLGLLEARAAHRAPSGPDRAALATEVADAHAHGILVAAGDGTLAWSWDSRALATVRRTVATAALDLLTGPAGTRIRRCDGPDCGWLFLDTTKNASRRWCSMRGCGNQAKSRRRHHRR